jgi:hypothetical protein
MPAELAAVAAAAPLVAGMSVRSYCVLVRAFERREIGPRGNAFQSWIWSRLLPVAIWLVHYSIALQTDAEKGTWRSSGCFSQTAVQTQPL